MSAIIGFLKRPVGGIGQPSFRFDLRRDYEKFRNLWWRAHNYVVLRPFGGMPGEFSGYPFIKKPIQGIFPRLGARLFGKTVAEFTLEPTFSTFSPVTMGKYEECEITVYDPEVLTLAEEFVKQVNERYKKTGFNVRGSVIKGY